MTIISPSLLSCNFLDLQSELAPFEGTKNLWVHLDIMDGHFVPNLTFGIPIVKQLALTTQLPLDGHFMVSNPLFYIQAMKNVGLYNFTFHYEATGEPLDLIAKAKEHYSSVGLAIKPETPFSELSQDILRSIDLLLIMSVEPGRGGQSFMPQVLVKVREAVSLRKRQGYAYSIQIDGGMNEETAREAVHSGCDNLVAGSYIFSSDQSSYLKRVHSLRGEQ